MTTLDTNGRLNNLLNKSEIDDRNTDYIYQDLYDYIKKFNTNKDKILLSIVLPMYNEEKTIKTVLERLPYNNSIEIIVVNDHSTDSSLEEIEKVKLKREIRVVNHNRNLGYGAAIISGVSHSKGKIIVTMDTDG